MGRERKPFRFFGRFTQTASGGIEESVIGFLGASGNTISLVVQCLVFVYLILLGYELTESEQVVLTGLGWLLIVIPSVILLRGIIFAAGSMETGSPGGGAGIYWFLNFVFIGLFILWVNFNPNYHTKTLPMTIAYVVTKTAVQVVTPRLSELTAQFPKPPEFQGSGKNPPAPTTPSPPAVSTPPLRTAAISPCVGGYAILSVTDVLQTSNIRTAVNTCSKGAKITVPYGTMTDYFDPQGLGRDCTYFYSEGDIKLEWFNGKLMRLASTHPMQPGSAVVRIECQTESTPPQTAAAATATANAQRPDQLVCDLAHALKVEKPSGCP